ncbi:MAG: CsbD family protein [Ktedonobacterales bacterium]|nr:CsbD family protein [Ktedonobacterales bacterium]
MNPNEQDKTLGDHGRDHEGKGIADQIGGKIQEGIGKLTGDKGKEAEGKGHQAQGSLERKAGDAEQKIDDVIHN